MPSYLSARQAAKLLGKTPRMAARRAKEAAEQGDPTVIRVGRTWIAPESWWREHVKPKPMGRPRQSADAADAVIADNDQLLGLFGDPLKLEPF